MGSDRKSKDKHSKRTNSSSDSEDEERRRRRKRQKSIEAEEEEKKSNKKSSHKHSKRHSHKEKKSRDKDKGKHKKGDHESTYEFHELTKDDYFSKNNEFSTWLKEEKKLFFSDLSADLARDMFKDFVKAWNGEKLESKYYEGIASGPRSAHKWKLKS